MTRRDLAALREEVAREERRQHRITAMVRAADRAAAAAAARGAALAALGQLLRDDALDGGAIGVTGARAATGITRVTLTRLRDDPHGWDELVALAGRVLGGDDDAQDELHVRLPHLAGWWSAMHHLSRWHGTAWMETLPVEESVLRMTDSPPLPAYEELARVYWEVLRVLAAGRAGDTGPAT